MSHWSCDEESYRGQDDTALTGVDYDDKGFVLMLYILCLFCCTVH